MRTALVSNEQFGKFLNELEQAKSYFSSTQKLYDEAYRNFGKIENICGGDIGLAVEYDYHNDKITTYNAELTDDDCNTVDLTLSDEQYKQLENKLEDILL